MAEDGDLMLGGESGLIGREQIGESFNGVGGCRVIEEM